MELAEDEVWLPPAGTRDARRSGSRVLGRLQGGDCGFHNLPSFGSLESSLAAAILDFWMLVEQREHPIFLLLFGRGSRRVLHFVARCQLDKTMTPENTSTFSFYAFSHVFIPRGLFGI